MFKYLISVCALFYFVSNNAQIQSPDSFLGYELGTQFSRHHQVVDYFKHLDANSSLLKLQAYGKTNEGRVLQLAFISSKENLENFESIRREHLQNSGIISGPKNDNKVVVWLSYNVHGNESSSTEAAMKTAHALLTTYSEWLKDTVVILDPCINPDGRDRYVNFYNRVKSSPNNTEGFTREHREGWHNGRTNHYIFDLNRDWAWLTQKESQQRIKKYNQWLPHVHVDFHEQGINSPYYFAPAAEPLHEIITPFQKQFQEVIGKNHAKYFDQKGWFYFTKQRFDLLYPSYGDSYPTFMGGIGMTYEQAGGGIAGLGIENNEAITLSLKDRIEHHFTTGISTVEIATINKSILNKNYQSYFIDQNYKYQNYILEGPKHRLDALQKLLDYHEIKSEQLKKKSLIKGYEYQQQKNSSSSYAANSLVVSTNQTKGKMVQVLLEPKTKLQDSLTYDITAWSLPYAYGLKAMATENSVETVPYRQAESESIILSESAYGYALDYNSFNDSQFLAALLKANIGVRFNETPLRNSNKNWDRGSLFILRADNQNNENYLEKTAELAGQFKQILTPITSGFSDSGPDLGAAELVLIKAPRIGLLRSDAASSYNYGEIWHFFEQALNYPVLQLEESQLISALESIDQLILPSGYYNQWDIENSADKALLEWIKKGGKLIVMANALERFADHPSFDLSKKEPEPFNTTQINYSDLERSEISYMTTGSIFEVKLDPSHPLSFGIERYYTLKLDEKAYNLLSNQYNPFTLGSKAQPLAGFIGHKAINNQSNALVVGIESKGRGKLVYFVDNVLFRGFWYSGKLLFSNALFFL